MVPSARLSLLAGASGFALIAAACDARADTVLTTYTYSLGTGGTVPASNGNSQLGVATAILTPGFSDRLGNAVSGVTGGVLGTAYGYSFATDARAVGTASLTTGFDYKFTIQNTNTGPGDFILQYVVPFEDLTVSQTGPGSTFAQDTVTIKFGGNTVVDYVATLSKATLDATPVFTETGGSFGLTKVNDGSYATLEPSVQTVNLGRLAPGVIVSIDYALQSTATSVYGAAGSGCVNGGYGGFVCATQSFANFGDPLTVLQTGVTPGTVPGSQLAAAAEVDAPAMGGAFAAGAGLLGLAGRRRARV